MLKKGEGKFKKTKNSDADTDGDMNIEDKSIKKYVEKTCQVIKKIDAIELPKPKEQLRIVTMQVFNSVSIIKLIAEKEVISEAVFVIFAINQKAATVLIELKKAELIKEAKLIVSSIRNPGHKSKSIAVDMLKDHYPVMYVNSHAKISVMKTEKGNHYNVEGSGNFSFNGRIEQYVIDNDIEMYEFSKEWIKEIEQYKMK